MDSEPERFSAHLDHLDGNAIVLLHGELDLASASEFRNALEDLLAVGGPPEIVVDLAELDFLDSSGLAVLITAQKALNDQGRRLVIRSAKPNQIKVFEVTGLIDYLNVEVERPNEVELRFGSLFPSPPEAVSNR